ncbi:MAG: response regulator [Dehalococcoidia bacterium]|jgi:putative nucleotidyltransferase with HDIG domain
MTGKGFKILVVDDEATVRRLLCQRLSREGYKCEEASSAEQALENMKEGPADVVILDIKMPGKSGMELLPELRAAYPDTAIMMATALNDINISIQCMKEGAYDYICKPFNLAEVVMSVKGVLEKKQLEREIKEYQRYLEEKVEEQTKEIRKVFLGAIEALAFALEAKDQYTAGHSRRVTEIAVAIGKEMGLSKECVEDLRWGGLLHDVGKIAIDQIIQNKPGKLTEAEYEHIMTHANVGAGIVRPVVNSKVVEMIEHHHDRYDGKGMNQVVAGEDIPLCARILAVADSFDAMTSDRPYRAAMSVDEALEEIKRCTGSQFDPEVAAAFLKIPVTGIVLAEA